MNPVTQIPPHFTRGKKWAALPNVPRVL